MWSPVVGLQINTDRVFGYVDVDPAYPKLTYLPLGQEFLQIRFRDSMEHGALDHNVTEGFVLSSRAELLTREQTQVFRDQMQKWEFGSKTLQNRTQDYQLFVTPFDVLEEGMRDLGLESLDQGNVFVSINLAALGLDYRDVRIVAKDFGGRSVGRFVMLPQKATGSQSNPKWVRGFLSDLPVGQFSLVVSNSQGAVKWLDIVRSQPAALQVLTVKE
jgi:hypothetical protein